MRGDLLECADGWQRAVESRDVVAASESLHEDFALVLVQPAEAIMPREQWLKTLTDYVVHEYAVLARVSHERDNLGLIFQRVRMNATVLGEDRSGIFAISDLWLRDPDGEWLIWRRHSTPITAGELPVAPP